MLSQAAALHQNRLTGNVPGGIGCQEPGGSMANRSPFIFLSLYKGADGFMSNDQFAKFYWPFLRDVMVGFIDNGCIPAPFVEGGYNQRLEFITDLPVGKSLFIFDRTDMVRAREILGGKSCIGGGIKVSLILAGTLEQVERETKKMLDAVKGDGGYGLGIGTAMDDTRPGTLDAFIRAGRYMANINPL